MFFFAGERVTSVKKAPPNVTFYQNYLTRKKVIQKGKNSFSFQLSAVVVRDAGYLCF